MAKKLRPIFTIVTKRASGDCAVAALATLLQVSYEEVLVAAVNVQPLVLKTGLNNDEIIAVAKLFGRTLEERTGEEIDYRRSTGMLGAKLSINKGADEHAVVLCQGLVFDVEDGEVWRAREYLKRYKAKHIDLLELED